MTPAAIIHEAASRGVTLRVEGTDLLYHGPRGALCPKLKAALKAHKPAIICELMGSDTASAFCPADVTERATIIAEGDGCSRLEADRRALSRARPAIVAGPRGATPGRDHFGSRTAAEKMHR